MNPLRKLAGQTLIYGAGTIVPRLLNYLLLTPFYTRVFDTAQYGVITELYAYVAFLLVLLTYGMETAFFRFSESHFDKRKVYDTAATTLLTTSVAFILLTTYFSPEIAGLIRYSGHPEYIIYFAMIVGVDAFLSIPFARLRQENRATRFTLIKIANIMVNLFFNFFFLWYCPTEIDRNPNSILTTIYDPSIGVGYAFIANLIATLFTMVLLLPEILRFSIKYNKLILSKMLNYAYPVMIIGLAGMINEVSDKLMLKYLLPDKQNALHQLGIYGANFKLGILMSLFIQMFRYAAEPFFFNQAKEENAQRIYASVMKYFLIFGLLIFLGVNFYIDIIKYFIGSDFHEGLHIVPVILLAYLFLGIFYNLSVWYKLNNKTLFGASIAVIGAVTTILLNLVLIPHYGYEGAAWAHLICYLLMCVISFFWGRLVYPVPYNLVKMGFYFLTGLILFFVAREVEISDDVSRYFFNTFLLILFSTIVFIAEKKELGKTGK